MSEWLTKQFLAWQKQTEKRQTVTSFAAYLGVSRDVLNQWMNGRRKPSGQSVELLAEKLGDEVYDVLGIARPDPRLQAIMKLWGRLSDEIRQGLFEEAERLAAHGADDKAVAAPKRRSKN